RRRGQGAQSIARCLLPAHRSCSSRLVDDRAHLLPGGKQLAALLQALAERETRLKPVLSAQRPRAERLAQIVLGGGVLRAPRRGKPEDGGGGRLRRGADWISERQAERAHSGGGGRSDVLKIDGRVPEFHTWAVLETADSSPEDEIHSQSHPEIPRD